jgi:hypothetical protein
MLFRIWMKIINIKWNTNVSWMQQFWWTILLKYLLAFYKIILVIFQRDNEFCDEYIKENHF